MIELNSSLQIIPIRTHAPFEMVFASTTIKAISNTTLIIPIEVLRDTKRDLDIVTSGLHVNLDATGRSNNENPQSRSTWTSQSLTDNNITTTVKFNNFNWYNNGWITDINGDTCLRISNGASIEIPLSVMVYHVIRWLVLLIPYLALLLPNKKGETPILLVLAFRGISIS